MTILADAARSRGAGSTDGVPRGQMLPGQSRRPWDDTTLLKVEGNFNVTGPLESFANAGGVHLARAILAEFAENVAKLVAERAEGATASHPDPLSAGEENERPAPRQNDEHPRTAATPVLSGGKILWRAFVSWLRQVFFGKREAQ